MLFLQSSLRRTILLSCLVAAFLTPSTAEAADGATKEIDICMGEKKRSWIWPFNQKCQGMERKARVYIPELPDNKIPAKVPLLLNLHALGSNGFVQQVYTQFDDIADNEKFVVAYPEGIAKARVGTPLAAPKLLPLFSFNAGGCCAEACNPDAINPPKGSKNKAPIDDIGFFKELVKHIQEVTSKENNFIIDTERIYATGMSNGGFMTNRVACEMSDIVAAVAPVAGPLMNEAGDGTAPFMWGADPFVCAPGRPVPLLHFHSNEDAVVPFEGSKDFGFPSIPSSIEKWRVINGVKDVEPVITYDEGLTSCKSYGPGTSSSVTLCEMISKSHCWPGEGIAMCGNGIGNQYIWDFFKNHTLGGGFVGVEDGVTKESSIPSASITPKAAKSSKSSSSNVGGEL